MRKSCGQARQRALRGPGRQVRTLKDQGLEPAETSSMAGWPDAEHWRWHH